MVVVECLVVVRVDAEVVRGPAADVQAAIRRANTTTEIGVRIRSSGLGGRWCRLIDVGPGGSTEVGGRPAPRRRLPTGSLGWHASRNGASVCLR